MTAKTNTNTAQPNLVSHLFSLLLRDNAELDAELITRARQASLIRGLVLFSTVGFLVHGVAVGLVSYAVPLRASSDVAWMLQGTPIIWLPLALAGSLLLANAVCLPSFYFYTQMAGIDAPLRLVAVQTLRIQARTSVLLLGVVPFYLAVGMATPLGLGLQPEAVLLLGLALPFIVGLAGVVSLRESFARIAESLPRRREDGASFVTAMTTAWGAVFTAIAPVALLRLAETLGPWV